MPLSDFDPEFAGSPANRAAQRTTLALRGAILGRPGLVSRGNRVAHLAAAEDSTKELVAIAERFGAAIFFLDRRQADERRSPFEAAGFATAAFTVFRPTAETFARCADIAAADLPGRLGLRLERITPQSPHEEVAALQACLDAAGLPPLPGYFLRGRLEPTLTLVLRDPAGGIAGCAVAMDEAGAGPGFAGWYFPSSVAVAAPWRGQGLGRWLNAAAIDLARREGGAHHVQQGVTPGNQVSQRMIRACGLAAVDSPVGVLAIREAAAGAWR